MSIIKEIFDRLSPYKGRIIGVLFGLILAILVLSIGFLRALVVGLFMVLGFYLGKKADNQESLVDLWERLRRNRNG